MIASIFIGGVVDGRRTVTSGLDVHRFEKFPPMTETDLLIAGQEGMPQGTIHLYTRRFWRAAEYQPTDRRVAIYAPRDMPDHEVLLRLLDAYPKEKR